MQLINLLQLIHFYFKLLTIIYSVLLSLKLHHQINQNIIQLFCVIQYYKNYTKPYYYLLQVDIIYIVLTVQYVCKTNLLPMMEHHVEISDT